LVTCWLSSNVGFLLFKNFEKFILVLSEKKKLVRNIWKVYTRPTSASDFLGIKSPQTCKLAIYVFFASEPNIFHILYV
jgi:dTDP-4-dehydrorhamnose reductase